MPNTMGSERRLIASFVGLMMTAGCASLPNVEDLLNKTAPSRRPTLVDADGPLSAGATKKVLAGLEREVGPANILRKHLAESETITGSPLVVGNSVRLFSDGPSTYEAMFQAIEGAKNHINLETYIFEDDTVGRRLAELLIKKEKEGVQVNIIYDSFGSIETSDAFFERLRAGGLKVVEFNPVNPLDVKRRWMVNQRDHRKILVVDGAIAFTGGVNISRVYSRSPFRSRGPKSPEAAKQLWRDTHVQIDGPVVAEFQRIFLDAWTQQKGPPLPEHAYFPALNAAGKLIVRAINSSPAADLVTIYQVLISAISHAEQSIHLTVAYFAPDGRMLKALTDAAARGVDVTLLLPSVTDSGLVVRAGHSHYETLLQAGVKIHELQGALLHSKTAVIDGVWSTVGSANLDWRSFLHNEEVNAVILGGEFADRMEALFQKDLAASRRVTLKEWKTRPFIHRVKETMGRIMEYWL
ncbi:MAG: cardiolipin synthase [Nitrospiria bacterium]